MQNVRAVSAIAVAFAVALVAAPELAGDPQSASALQADPQALVPDMGRVVAGGWVPALPLTGAGLVRYAHAQCIGSNSFYLISGVANGAIVTTVQRYDAGTNTWNPLAPIPVGSEGPVGICVGTKLYVAGGGVGGLGSTNFFIYDIAGNTWSSGAAVPRAQWGGAMGSLAGKIYLAGGDSDFQPANGVSNVVNVYDIATNTWLADGASMPSGVDSGGFAQIGKYLYVVGGWFASSPGSNLNTTQRYDMSTDTWTTGPTYTSARADQAVAATATALYSIGGDNNAGGFFDSSTVVERLDVTTWPSGAWTVSTPLPAGRTGHKGGFCTQSFFPSAGEVWSTGGLDPGFIFTTTNQYLPAEACPAGVTPTVLDVNASGNRVLEPNEAMVVVAPTWKNGGGSTIGSLTGVASAFTGPAGPTYTINDAGADYGSIAAGSQASCTVTGNCYQVTVTAATRPIQHWDSTFLETLSVGAIKTWTLHVGGSFTDVPTTNGFYRFIETIFHKGVTGGCATDTYCPANPTTREQMAVFALVSKEGAGYSPPACSPPNYFSDVPETSPFCRYIEELANRGVVSGCGPNLYCPTSPVTREQMSIFMLRTLDPTLNPPACAPPNLFADVPETSPFCKWIEELAARGVVSGCGGGNYCPTQAVTREQMGVFLSLTFGLNLYGP